MVYETIRKGKYLDGAFGTVAVVAAFYRYDGANFCRLWNSCFKTDLRLRFFSSMGYLLYMRLLNCLLIVFASCFLFPVAGFSQAKDSIDIGEAVRRGEGRLAIAVESPDATIAALGRRAFGLHGGYAVASVDKAAFVLNIQQNGNAEVLLTISSGKPLQEQLRRSVSGRDLKNAVLRACDLAVEATTPGAKGFFAGKLAFVGKQRGISEIYVCDLLFGNVRPLTRDRSLVTGPSWSPDGSKLLYTTYYKSGFPDIYMIDLQNGAKTPVANFKGTNTGGRFSRDGRRIAMSLSGTGNSEIWVGDSMGRNRKRLTENQSLEASPSWSPDGSRLVYTSDAPGRPQLYEISINGGSSQRIPTNVSNYCSEPAWNPVKENLIAFTAAVGSGFQIALYDANTRSSKILTSVRSDAVEPAWLNDGRHLIFTQRQNGGMRLMLLDTETGKVSELHNPSFGDASSASFVY